MWNQRLKLVLVARVMSLSSTVYSTESDTATGVCTGRTYRFRGAYTSIKAEPSTFEAMLNEENESVLAG
jgi:hypothetical protein